MGIKVYITSIMREQRKGPVSLIVSFILLVLSFIYAAGIKIVDWGYRSGFRKVTKVPVLTVSVGNITVGGTGKTPFSIYLADHFTAKGLKTAIITRGYGRDENVMIKDELPEVPVIVGQDRVKSALRAKNSGMDVVILDDGFQHRRLYRDLDILLIDSVTFPDNGKLLPRGELREPFCSVRRADLFVLTKIDAAGKDRKKYIEDRLSEYAPDIPVITVRHKPVSLTDVTGALYSVEDIRGREILLVSAIADPDYFRFLIEENGGIVAAQKIYSDHYQYGQSDIRALNADREKYNVDMIITTGKDYVKMRELDISSLEENLFVLNIIIDVEEGKEKLVAGLDSFIYSQGV